MRYLPLLACLAGCTLRKEFGVVHAVNGGTALVPYGHRLSLRVGGRRFAHVELTDLPQGVKYLGYEMGDLHFAVRGQGLIAGTVDGQHFSCHIRLP